MRLFLLFLTGLLCSGVQAANVRSVDDLIRQATQAQLGQHSAWLALLHYKKEAFLGRLISQADDKQFFKSADGKTDPQAELEADIKAFLMPQASGHAQCLFPARWYWLKQQLRLPSEYDVLCPKLQAWMNKVSIDKLTLVFPAMYLGNPGSTFGHTFLRFDGTDSIMLSQTINYAAAYEPQDSFPAYIYNGVFGGYQGVFLSRQYFETVQLYSDIENRDIWEYQLDYSPDEIRQLARHAWEVSGIRFDYFFFRENCSYRLLGMLDAAKPEGELTTGDAFPFYAIPVDTVRALDEKHLILNKQYRASLASQLQAGFMNQKPPQRNWVIQLAEGELPVTELEEKVANEERRVEMYELAYTLLQFRNQAETPVAEEILKARSRLPKVTNTVVDVNVPPESGHKSARFALGGGAQNNQSYMDIAFRPTFHDLVDAPPGYVEGSEINVLDTRLRWLPDEDKMLLESLRFFNVVSLTPVKDWYKPLSWQLDVRLERTRIEKETSDLAFVTRGGGGYSARWANTTLFAMALLEANISNDYTDGYSLLMGVELGASIQLGFGQALVLIENNEPVSGFELNRESVSAELQYNLAANTAIRLGYKKKRYDDFDDEDWFVRLQQYY